jgi:hypothetical protein
MGLSADRNIAALVHANLSRRPIGLHLPAGRFAPKKFPRRMKTETKLFIKFFRGKPLGHLHASHESVAFSIDDLVATLLKALRQAGLPTQRDDLLLKVRWMEGTAAFDGLFLTPKAVAYFYFGAPHVRRKEAEEFMAVGLDNRQFFLTHRDGDPTRLFKMDVLPPQTDLFNLTTQLWSAETGIIATEDGRVPHPMNN